MALLLNGEMRATVSPTPLADDLKCLLMRKAQGDGAASPQSRRQPSCGGRGSCLGWTVHRRFDKCTAPGRLRSVPRSPERRGCVAQLVEQLTLNQRVQGSNPCTPTNVFNGLAENRGHERTKNWVGVTPRVTVKNERSAAAKMHDRNDRTS